MIDFTKKQIFAMIHLAGIDPVKTALKEIEILREEGVHGIIVENYHGTEKDVYETLKNIRKGDLIIGVNILPNEFESAFMLASEYGDFIQMDYVSGKYISNIYLGKELYNKCRYAYRDVKVFGGVWPKYYKPAPGSNLEYDLKEAMNLCDAIVVTGEGTGKETPLDKIKNFREIIGDFPLVIGAGLNEDNAVEQMSIGNAGIVGSCLKENGRTSNEISRELVRKFMNELNKI